MGAGLTAAKLGIAANLAETGVGLAQGAVDAKLAVAGAVAGAGAGLLRTKARLVGVGANLASGLVGAKLAYLGDLAGAGAKLVGAKLALGKGALRAGLVATRGVLDTKIHHLDSRYDQLKEPIWLPEVEFIFNPEEYKFHPEEYQVHSEEYQYLEQPEDTKWSAVESSGGYKK